MNVAQSTNKSGFPKWTQPRRWNPFSDFAFDRKYEIRILKSKSRFPNRTQPEIYVFGFFFFFLPFDWEIRKRVWKTVLKNSGLARARISSKKKTAVHENSFANPFSDFTIERQKGNPWNPDVNFLIEIHPEDGFLGGEIRSDAFDCKIRNPDFPIERVIGSWQHFTSNMEPLDYAR